MRKDQKNWVFLHGLILLCALGILGEFTSAFRETRYTEEVEANFVMLYPYQSISDNGYVSFDIKTNGSFFVVAYGTNLTQLFLINPENWEEYFANQSLYTFTMERDLVSFNRVYDLDIYPYNFMFLILQDLAWNFRMEMEPPKSVTLSGGWVGSVGMLGIMFLIWKRGKIFHQLEAKTKEK